MKTHHIVLLVSVLIALVILSCSDKSTNPNRPIDPYGNLLDNVTFVPSSGSPGTIIELHELGTLTGDTNWTLYIGGQFAPLLRETGKPVYTVIPVFYDSGDSSWPSPPPAPVSVSIHFNGQPVDSVLSAITVDSLPHAPDASDSLIADLARGIAALRSLAVALNIPDTLLLATCDAYDEVLYTGENSLAAILNGTSSLVGVGSAGSELFSALLVSSGFADLFSNWADSLEFAAGKMAATHRITPLATDITDEGLAARMQLQQLISDFGTIAVGNTAVSWQQVSAVIGAMSIVLPVVGYFEFIVSFIIGELDFVINKLAVAMLPSEITELSLSLPPDTLHPGDTTSAVVYISAKNNPPNITPADIMMQVLGGLQITDWLRQVGVPRQALDQLEDMNAVLLSVTTWFLTVINNILATNYNSPTSLDVSLPRMTWDSVQVFNPGLIDLVSPDLSKIAYLTGSFNGQAKDSVGPVTIQVRTQPSGPTTWIHPTLVALGYTNGPFGDDFVLSNADTVVICPQLVLDATLPSPIDADSSAQLDIQAGYRTSDGGTRWAGGINLFLSATGADLSFYGGSTNSTGQFSVVVTPDGSLPQIEIEIIAQGAMGTQVTDTVYADVDDSYDGLLLFKARRCRISTGAQALYVNDSRSDDTYETDPNYLLPYSNSLSANSSDYWPGYEPGECELSGSASADASQYSYITDDTLNQRTMISFNGTALGTANLTVNAWDGISDCEGVSYGVAYSEMGVVFELTSHATLHLVINPSFGEMAIIEAYLDRVDDITFYPIANLYYLEEADEAIPGVSIDTSFALSPDHYQLYLRINGRASSSFNYGSSVNTGGEQSTMSVTATFQH